MTLTKSTVAKSRKRRPMTRAHRPWIEVLDDRVLLASAVLGMADTVASPALAISKSSGSAQGQVATASLVTASSLASSSANTVSVSSVPETKDLTSTFDKFATNYGLKITDSSSNYQVGTGGEIMGNPTYSGAPLQTPTSYYFAQRTSGASISFGGLTLPATPLTPITIIVNPSDPFVYVKSLNFSFGASAQGNIPFVPSAAGYLAGPKEIGPYVASGPTFFGNLYGSVQDVKLGGLPIYATGNITVNTDPKGSGHGFDLKNAASLFTSAGLEAAFSNIDIGVNGSLREGVKLGGVDLTLPLGAASVGYTSATDKILVVKPEYSDFQSGVPKTLPYSQANLAKTFNPRSGGKVKGSQAFSVEPLYQPARFGFAGNTTNPLEGTAFASAFQGTQFSAKVTSSGSDLSEILNNVRASFVYQQGQAIKLGGYTFGGPSQTFSIGGSSSSIGFAGYTKVFIGAAYLTGNVNLRNGAFDLTAKFNSDSGAIPIMPAKNFLHKSSATVIFANKPGADNKPNFSFYADASLQFNYNTNVSILGVDLGDYGIYGDIYGKININPANNNYSGAVHVGGGFLVASRKVGGSIGVSFLNNTINASADIPVVGQFGFSYTI